MHSQSWIMEAILWAVFMKMSLRAECYYEADKIVSLPGQPSVSFQQYSGYITIDVHQKRSLFYYFVEAESDPASKPLVLWLNGGPGCSSLGGGAFIEHGPFRPKGDVLIRNDFSWNNVANILYLESPAGVGFSFSANTTFYTNTNDRITAHDNLVFLQRWFDKFPEYRNRDFFITGESYAGHYVPQLAKLIIESKVNIKLKAIAIGNPLLEFKTDFDSRGEYFWSHGLISDSTYELLKSVCSISQMIREDIKGNLSAGCSKVDDLLTKEISIFINLYSINLNICLSSLQSQLGILHSLSSKDGDQSNQKSQSSLPQYSEDTGKIDVCILDEVTNYLNRLDVQKALHAQLVGVTNWTLCSNVLQYDMTNLLIPTIYTVNSLVQSGIRVLVYSGDQDSVIPLIGSRTLVNTLAKNLRLNTTLPYSAWFYKQQAIINVISGGLVRTPGFSNLHIGWVQAFGVDNILSFATIRGAAHQAPYTSPGRSLSLFSAFLAGKNP